MAIKTWIATQSAANNFHISTNWTPSGDPIATDDLYFGTSSIPCLLATTGTCSCIIFGSYSGTFSFTGGAGNNLNLTGQSGKTYSYSPFMKAVNSSSNAIFMSNTTFNLQANGGTPSLNAQISNGTVSFLDNWNQNANWTNVGSSNTWNGSITYSQISGTLNIGGGGSYLYGNLSTLQLIGGIMTGRAYNFLSNIYINPISSVTLTGPFTFIYPSNPTISYSGTGITTVTGQLSVSSANFNTNGMTWSSISTNATASWNLGSNLQTSSSVSINNPTTVIGSYNMYLTGISCGGSGYITSTQSTLYIIGGSSDIATSNGANLNIYLQGNNTINRLFFNGNNTLTYLSGTASIANLTIQDYHVSGSPTLNLNGVSITNMLVGQHTATSSYVILSSPLNVTTLTFGNSGTLYQYANFTGSYGFTTQVLQAGYSTGILQLNPTNTYLVTSTFSNTISGNTARAYIKSLIPGTKAVLTFQSGAKCNVAYQNAIDIDSSSGRTINSFNGTFSNTLNWRNLTDIPTVSFNFVL